jgi:nitroreductase
MKDFLSLACQRQSDRAFDPNRPVEKEKIERILQAACIAPSACNSQPWHFIVVDEPELKNRLADATSGKLLGINHFTKQAPIHIVVVEEKSNMTASLGAWVKDKNFAHLDVGIAAAHIVLAAEDEGLGSCIIGWFDEEKVRQLLHVPKGKRILLDIVVGYSTQPDRIKKRKDPKEMISYNQY